jgi:hypothetical protein
MDQIMDTKMKGTHYRTYNSIGLSKKETSSARKMAHPDSDSTEVSPSTYGNLMQWGPLLPKGED